MRHTMQEQELSARKWEVRTKAGRVFSPSHPVDRRDLFAGRIRELEKLLDAVNRRGGHAAVYGERGVGKTSIVSILTEIIGSAPGSFAHRENCHSDDTFARIWSRAFDGIKYVVARKKVGFDAPVESRLASLRDMLPDSPGPDDVVRALRSIDERVVFVFDEFDQIADKSVTNAFAETIKALSDYATSSTVVIVGIGDSIDTLLSSHASVARALTEVLMPRMKEVELREIISKSSRELGASFTDHAVDTIVKMSQGLPHYVHLLALHALRSAISRMEDSTIPEVTDGDVIAGIETAIEDASHSLKDEYLRAVSSPQKRTLFPNILLACALSANDELGFFAQSDVRDALKITGHDLEIPAFAAHLNKFCHDDRGNVLVKRGVSRKYRYRFQRPLLQPYVLMRGVRESLVTMDVVLHRPEPPKSPAPKTRAKRARKR